MTEDQIERRAERMMDRLDHQLMIGHMHQNRYDMMVKAIDAWVQAGGRRQYAEIHYELDLANQPKYHDGSPRKAWSQLDQICRDTWAI